MWGIPRSSRLPLFGCTLYAWALLGPTNLYTLLYMNVFLYVYFFVLRYFADEILDPSVFDYQNSTLTDVILQHMNSSFTGLTVSLVLTAILLLHVWQNFVYVYTRLTVGLLLTSVCLLCVHGGIWVSLYFFCKLHTYNS